MSATTTRAPSRANASADAWPIPDPAPVTTATSPCNFPTWLPPLRLQGLQHFVGVALDFDIGEHRLDRAVPGDDERRARDPHVLATHELFQLPHAILIGDGVVGVGQEREGQVIFGLKLLVGLDGVRADAEDLGPVLVEQATQVTEGACLGGAAWRIVARVEVQDDGLLA